MAISLSTVLAIVFIFVAYIAFCAGLGLWFAQLIAGGVSEIIEESEHGTSECRSCSDS